MNYKKYSVLLFLVSMTTSCIGSDNNILLNRENNSNNINIYKTNNTKAVDFNSVENFKDGDIIPGQYIVKYKTNKSNISAFNNSNITKLKEVDKNNGIVLVKIEENTSRIGSQTTLDSLKNNPNIEYVEPNRIIKLNKTENSYNPPLIMKKTESAPNDPMFSEQYAHVKTNTIKGWSSYKKTKDVVIAIMDTGVDSTHPDLNVINGYSVFKGPYTPDITDPYTQPVSPDDINPNIDSRDHGTHVAGIAAAIANNKIGICGYAPGVKIMSVKVINKMGISSTAIFLEGLKYAINNADVINMSFDLRRNEKSISEAITDGLNKNKIFVSSMGNTGNDEQTDFNSFDGIISVGATDKNDAKAGFSQFGSYISVVAPGVDILSTMPAKQNNYGCLSGTSMAAPAVSGLAALLKSQEPNLTTKQIKERIEKGADDLGSSGFDNYYGHGRINVYNTIKNLKGKGK